MQLIMRRNNMNGSHILFTGIKIIHGVYLLSFLNFFSRKQRRRFARLVYEKKELQVILKVFSEQVLFYDLFLIMTKDVL